MLHLQQLSKILIRLTLLLLLLQFAAPAFAHVGTSDGAIQEKNSYKTQQEPGITVSVFLKETSEEQNESHGKTSFSLKLIDFKCREVVLTQLHSQILCDHGNTQSVATGLFKLHCTFLI